MGFDLSIRQGDTLPVFTQVITDQDDVPVDLAGCTVQFVMRLKSNPAPTINTPAAITNASAGEVQYSWTAGDTAVAGIYMATLRVDNGDGGTFTFPNDGWLEIQIIENLVTAGASALLSLGEVKDYLEIDDDDRDYDTKLISFINQLRPVVESITGPIIPAQYDEWYDGGSTSITLRHRPNVGFGTDPVLLIQACSEYVGPIEWPLAVVPSPDQGQLYSIMVDKRLGRITRRTAGGGVQGFPDGPESVHVIYTSGQSSVPTNVEMGCKDLIRIHFQQTQQGRPRAGGANYGDDGDGMGEIIYGFFVPNRVRELLSPGRRFPALA